jgi:membrane protein YdbS with pleckstrin-like domain
VTDPSHTLSGIQDEGDPAAGRTTPPERAQPAPEHAPQHAELATAAAPQTDSAAESPPRTGPEPQTDVQPEPQPPEVADATPPSHANETADTSSSTVTSSSTMTSPLGFPEGEPQSLHPAHLRTQMIAHWIAVCVMAFAAFTILSGLTLGGKLHGARLVVVPGLVVTGIGLLAWWGWRYQHIEHARTSFVISLAGCEIRRGVLWRRIITVPLSRIQHSDVTQGPLQRAYGLATLTLYTAGTEHAKIDLHGLAFETAMAIRQYLFERSEAHDR